MATHCILLSSAYSIGKRIALDYIIEDSTEDPKKALEKIMEECGKGIPISTHMIQADGDDWNSVVERDAYFKDVKLITNIDKFIELIRKDRSLEGIDVAKYILTQVPCTHLKLEKLTYICFADYLCEVGKRLFTDRILAYQYGPVVDTVYQACVAKYGYLELEKEKKEIPEKKSLDMAMRSRILCAEDGTKKLRSIDKTLAKYGKMTAGQLVKITHRENSPWSNVKNKFSLFYKKQIKDDIIKEFHKFETI